MKRYRTLTREELEEVESDLIQFLAESGVTAGDWERWKAADDPRVGELIESFSEGFWDRATSKITYLERRSEHEAWLFHFGTHEAHLLRCVVDASSGTAEWYEGTKTFEEEARGREIFLLLEQGAQPVDEARWNAVVAAKNGVHLN